MTLSGCTILACGHCVSRLVFEKLCLPTIAPVWIPVRHRNTVLDKRWRHQRRKKVMKVELPDWAAILGDRKEERTMEEAKAELKKMGMVPPRKYDSTPIYLQATGAIFEPYVPPEGDGRSSIVSTEGLKDTYSTAAMKTKSVNAVRKMRKFEEDFKTKDFGPIALDVYKSAHRALQDCDEDALHEHVTERAFPEMIEEAELKTVRWNYVESLEAPRVVHVRLTELLSKDDVFAQITIRFHSKQTLAVYDRFGRLMYGSETVPKNVLEYIVFERQMANEYSKWRLHGKIIPKWMPQPEPSWRTFRVEDEKEEKEEEDLEPVEIFKHGTVFA